jgi:uncharacterized membrane protein
MTDWQATIHLSKFQLKRDWLGLVFTFAFTLYVSMIIGSSIGDLFDNSKTPRGFGGAVDVLYLCILPVFGLLMNKTSFRIWRRNSYQRRLAHWRAMPIPSRAIVLARWLQSVFMIPVLGAVFMILQYFLSDGIRSQATPIEWLENSVVWISYGLAAVSFFIFLELGASGKQYVIWYCGYYAAAILLSVVLVVRKIFLVGEVLAQVKEHPVMAIVCAVLIAAIATAIGFRQTLKRVRSQSYTF